MDRTWVYVARQQVAGGDCDWLARTLDLNFTGQSSTPGRARTKDRFSVLPVQLLYKQSCPLCAKQALKIVAYSRRQITASVTDKPKRFLLSDVALIRRVV